MVSERSRVKKVVEIMVHVHGGRTHKLVCIICDLPNICCHLGILEHHVAKHPECPVYCCYILGCEAKSPTEKGMQFHLEHCHLSNTEKEKREAKRRLRKRGPEQMAPLDLSVKKKK